MDYCDLIIGDWSIRLCAYNSKLYNDSFSGSRAQLKEKLSNVYYKRATADPVQRLALPEFEPTPTDAFPWSPLFGHHEPSPLDIEAKGSLDVAYVEEGDRTRSVSVSQAFSYGEA